MSLLNVTKSELLHYWFMFQRTIYWLFIPLILFTCRKPQEDLFLLKRIKQDSLIYYAKASALFDSKTYNQLHSKTQKQYVNDFYAKSADRRACSLLKEEVQLRFIEETLLAYANDTAIVEGITMVASIIHNYQYRNIGEHHTTYSMNFHSKIHAFMALAKHLNYPVTPFKYCATTKKENLEKAFQLSISCSFNLKHEVCMEPLKEEQWYKDILENLIQSTKNMLRFLPNFHY